MAKNSKKEKKQKKDKKDKQPKTKLSKSKKSAAGKSGSSKKGSKKRAGSKDLRALAKKIVDLTTVNDDEAVFGFYADDVESVEMNMPVMVGLAAIRTKFEGWRNMVSNAKFTAENVWVDGNTIIIEWIGDVTITATGKQAQLREIAIHEIEDGKIARERYYYNPAVLQP